MYLVPPSLLVTNREELIPSLFSVQKQQNSKDINGEYKLHHRPVLAEMPLTVCLESPLPLCAIFPTTISQGSVTLWESLWQLSHQPQQASWSAVFCFYGSISSG